MGCVIFEVGTTGKAWSSGKAIKKGTELVSSLIKYFQTSLHDIGCSSRYRETLYINIYYFDFIRSGPELSFISCIPSL